MGFSTVEFYTENAEHMHYFEDIRDTLEDEQMSARIEARISMMKNKTSKLLCIQKLNRFKIDMLSLKRKILNHKLLVSIGWKEGAVTKGKRDEGRNETLSSFNVPSHNEIKSYQEKRVH